MLVSTFATNSKSRTNLFDGNYYVATIDQLSLELLRDNALPSLHDTEEEPFMHQISLFGCLEKIINELMNVKLVV